MTDFAPEFVDTRTAGIITGLSPATLTTMRTRGGGPPYVKIGVSRRGRVNYAVADLRAWMQARRRRSTSDTTGALAAAA